MVACVSAEHLDLRGIWEMSYILALLQIFLEPIEAHDRERSDGQLMKFIRYVSDLEGSISQALPNVDGCYSSARPFVLSTP